MNMAPSRANSFLQELTPNEAYSHRKEFVPSWLVVLGLTALCDSNSVYIGLSLREREKEKRNDRRKKKCPNNPHPHPLLAQ